MISKEELLNFPDDIRSFITDEMEDLTNGIADKFALDAEQRMFVFDLDDQIFLKNMDVLQLPNKLDGMSGADKIDMRLLALDIAYKVLWPLQEYLGGIDRLILRLGGKVPRIRPLKGQKKDISGLFPGTGEGTVKKMMGQFTDFRELRLTSKKILNKKDISISPTIDNWIKDYISFVGAGEHDSLKRAKYLSKGRNVISLSEKEKESLRVLLVSYDQNSSAYFESKDGMLIASEIKKEEPKTSEAPGFDNILEELHQQIIQIDKSVLDSEFIMSEADGDIGKVRDVLWNAVGLQDKDKAVGCLKLLIEKQILDAMLREDKRFHGILKRFINIKYGKEFEGILEGDYDKLIIRRLLLEMLFTDKLRLNESEAVAIAFYLSNIKTDAGQLVYFDKTANKLKWRDLDTMGNKIVWAEQV